MSYRLLHLPSGVGVIVSVSAVVLVLLGGVPAHAGSQPAAVLRIKSTPTGEMDLEARGVTIEETLTAIAREAGFEVMIEQGITRPPVNVSVSSVPVEQLLHDVLRGRNYALVYDGDDDSLRRVIVLRPSTAQAFRGRNPWVPARSR